jgi:hypothetical protein
VGDRRQGWDREADAPRLFDDYVRARTATRCAAASVLGLASARRMAALMVRPGAWSAIGAAASAFWLELPARTRSCLTTAAR